MKPLLKRVTRVVGSRMFLQAPKPVGSINYQVAAAELSTGMGIENLRDS
jgi:hypothetical protein